MSDKATARDPEHEVLRAAMPRICKAVGIEIYEQLMVLAENNEETTADLLVKYIERREKAHQRAAEALRKLRGQAWQASIDWGKRSDWDSAVEEADAALAELDKREGRR